VWDARQLEGTVTVIATTIKGIPVSKGKKRGDRNAPKRWRIAIIENTRKLPVVSEACLLKVTFLLPGRSFPADFRYGPDLDNLLKGTLDALNETVFRNASGKDSCVVALFAMKAKVASESEAGMHLEILPVGLGEERSTCAGTVGADSK
jgi:Holliday junction resolvase RusA-like endonuclease